MTEQTRQRPQYTSLNEIQQRKAELLKEIRKDSKEMNTLLNGLFNKPVAKGRKGLSVSGIVNTGAGVVDGMLFAWKLYRKLKK
ncbi:hypothetical protein [Xylanibacter caecicola]|uniref:hypothetical protein n=1 Tax=Xylanibacter caecicola TaxID=2736294 RepID=UPI0025865BEE|nr:hypothetical protein [Xylanibacter caecicola]